MIKFLLLFLLAGAVACREEPSLEPSTVQQILSHRNLGLAYLEENRLEEAKTEFGKLTELAPEEPLGFADLGLTLLRLGEYEQAEKQVRKALEKSDDPDIRLILAEIHERSGRQDEALRELAISVQKNSSHVRSRYKISRLYSRASAQDRWQRVAEQLMHIVDSLPANLAARLQLIEALLRINRPDQAAVHLEQVRQQLPDLSSEAVSYLNRALTLMRSFKAQQALPNAVAVHNLLKPTPLYQASIIDLIGPGGAFIGFPLLQFSSKLAEKMQDQTSGIAGLRFSDVTASAGLSAVHSATGISLRDYEGDGDVDIYISGQNTLWKNERGKFVNVTLEAGLADVRESLFAAFADYDNDGKQDLYLVLRGQDRLYRNAGNGKLSDVTESAGLTHKENTRSGLFMDLDNEGDLDLLLPGESQLLAYRNNGDGTFSEFSRKLGLSDGGSLQRALFGDFDEDGDLDLFVAGENISALYTNLRQGRFQDITKASGLAGFKGMAAMAAGDYDNDGFLDLAAGSLYHNRGDGSFEPQRTLTAFLDTRFLDFDNDGFQDLIAVGSKNLLLRNDGSGGFQDVTTLLPATSASGKAVEVADYDSDGDEDIFRVDAKGKLQLLRNDGGNVNPWIRVQLLGLGPGSGKVNRDGIGAKVEIKAGKLYQMRTVINPITHFGLGSRKSADVVRIVWTNGVPQNHILPNSNQTIVEKQVLKGSCPFLYTWDGDKFAFLTDILWKSALGMPLGIMSSAPIYAFADSADEFLKIPGELLKMKDGLYTIQITEELWETPYFDKIQLVTVDHPNTVEIYIDERFLTPPFPPLKIYPVSQKIDPTSAVDEKGIDVLPLILKQDDTYIADLTPEKYQGLTEMHDLVLDLGRIRPLDEVTLFLQGWIFPGDASINVALSQSNRIKAVPPFLQVRDGKGNWKTVIHNLGFPMGKNKTVIANLTGKFPTADTHVRIRTNMQIYWDHIFFSKNEPRVPLRLTTLKAVRGSLHYRGFSRMYRKGRYGPHWFDYSRVTTGPQWRDLEGFYTRYGNVTPLLMEPDDKYVIMNAGDELTISFDAAQAPVLRPRWIRDFLLYSDGWIKDGDLSTAYSQTVEPLPFHAMSRYPYGKEESYPMDQEHREYLRNYNTRRVPKIPFGLR